VTVLTVTLNPCIDKTFTVDRVVPERKLSAGDVRRFPGGGGINVARAICRLGGDAHALWASGGSVGEDLATLLEDECVAHTPVAIRAGIRENLIIRDTSTDQQYRFGMPGPEIVEDERQDWLRRVREHGASARYVVLSGSLPDGVPLDWYGELIRAVPEDVPVVVDTKRAALGRALEVGVHLIKPNVHELEELVARELCGDDDIAAAARELIARRAVAVVVVSLGRGGALVVTERSAERLSAPSVPKRSKVGAGDSMVGGLVNALARGCSLAEAARWGVAAGAAAVMTEGTELCRREDTERLLGRVDHPEPLG
jgi:6-phosphofructokinase 2